MIACGTKTFYLRVGEEGFSFSLCFQYFFPSYFTKANNFIEKKKKEKFCKKKKKKLKEKKNEKLLKLKFRTSNDGCLDYFCSFLLFCCCTTTYKLFSMYIEILMIFLLSFFLYFHFLCSHYFLYRDRIFRLNLNNISQSICEVSHLSIYFLCFHFFYRFNHGIIFKVL